MSRTAKLGLAAVVLLLLVGAVLLALPEVVRRYAEARLRDAVAAPASIEDVDLNLFTGRGSISELRIGGADAGHPLLELPRIDFHLSTLRLLRGALRVYSVALIGPDLFLVRTGPTTFNVTEVLQLPKKDRPADAMQLTIEQLRIRDGSIVFVDQTVSPDFKQVFDNITLSAGPVSSMPQATVTPTLFDLRVAIGTGSVTVRGEASSLAAPTGIELTAHWQDLKPALFEAYLPSGPVIELDGTSSGEARYVLDPHKNQTHSLSANFSTGAINLYPPESQPGSDAAVFSVAGMEVKELRWDIASWEGRVARVALHEPQVEIERDAQGAFTITRLFGAEPEAETPDDGKAEQPPGIPLLVEELGVENGTIGFVDHAATPNVQATFSNLQLQIRHLSLAGTGKPAEIMAEARLRDSPVIIDGTLRLFPFTSNLQISTKNLPLEPYEGYLKHIWQNVNEWSGALDGKVNLQLAYDETLSVQLSGGLSATNMTLAFSDKGTPPFRAQRFSVQLAEWRAHPAFFLDIASLQISKAHLRIRRNRNGEFNLAPLWAAENDGTESRAKESKPASSQTESTSEPSFIIRSLAVKGSTIEFIDAAIQPVFTELLTDVNLEIGRFGRQSGFTPVRFQAAIAKTAEIELSGAVKPFETPLQIKLDGTVSGYDLAQLNPYATKFIQYRIARGRVTTDVEYNYDAGDLSGKNQIGIRQLRLGERLGDEFQERVGISLRLAIALLQDADGSINLTVPVTGDLSDPQFDWGGLIWRALGNAFVGIVSAPFRFIGRVVTSGNKIERIQIDPVEFQPGSTMLGAGGEKRLSQLSQLLADKPAIEIQIRGVATAEELEELKKQRLRRQVKGSAESYEAAIIRLYRLAIRERKGVETPANIEEMESYLAGNLVLEETALAELAAARAALVEEELVASGIEGSRLYVENTVTDGPGRVEFQLL